MSETYSPIPSLNNLYEINQRGIVRNTSTKRILQPFISFAKPKTSRTVASLLWEVHGIKPKGQNSRPISVICKNNSGEKYYFKSLRSCAEFLSPKTKYSVKTLEEYLSKRKKEIGEWKFIYD